MTKLAIKKGVILVNHERDVALFFHYGSRFLIRGNFVIRTLIQIYQKLQEKPRSRDQLLNELQDCPPSEIQDSLDSLNDLRFLIPCMPKPDDSYKSQDTNLVNFFNYFCGTTTDIDFTDPTGFLRKLQSKRILLLNLGFCGIEILNSLSKLGLAEIVFCDEQIVCDIDIKGHPEIFSTESLGTSRSDLIQRSPLGKTTRFEKKFNTLKLQSVDFIIASGTWYDIRALSSLNKVCIEEKKNWLLVIQDFWGGTIGPTLGMDGGPCFGCLIARRESNLMHVDKQKLVDSYFDKNRQDLNLNLPIFSEQLAGVAALETLKVLTDICFSKTYRGLYELDFLNHRQEFHEVLANPYCESCSPLFTKPKEKTNFNYA